MPLIGSQSRGEVPASKEAPSPTGKSVGTEGEHLRLSEEGEMDGLWQTGQSGTYTNGACHSLACPSLDVCLQCTQGLRAGTWGLESKLRGGTAVGCKETV